MRCGGRCRAFANSAKRCETSSKQRPLLRAVDENGEVKRTSDGCSDQVLSDIYLRNEFPPPGKAKAARPGDTPTDRYDNALGALSKAFDELDQCFEALSKVTGDDGQSIVDARGVDIRLTESWREILRRVDEDTVIWARAFRKMYGTKVDVVESRVEDEESDEDQDPYVDVDDEEDERAARSEREDENVSQ